MTSRHNSPSRWATQMKTLIYILVLAGLIVGCSQSQKAVPAKQTILPGYVRPDDPAITAAVAKAISTAKAHLEKTDGRPVDAFYKATKTTNGFDVHVEYVTGYDSSGQPIFIPGGHCHVVISDEGVVVEVQPGA